jgi:hypothetical protein
MQLRILHYVQDDSSEEGSSTVASIQFSGRILRLWLWMTELEWEWRQFSGRSFECVDRFAINFAQDDKPLKHQSQ